MRTITIGLLSFLNVLGWGITIGLAVGRTQADYKIKLLNPEGEVRIYYLKGNRTDTICVDDLVRYIDEDNL